MSGKIYIIERVNCRGEESTDKYSYDKEQFFSLLDLIDEDCMDDDSGEFNDTILAKMQELQEKGAWMLDMLIRNMLFECADFCDDGLTLQERIQAIKDGKYCAELEESVIAVGFSKKEAKANLIELEDDDEW